MGLNSDAELIWGVPVVAFTESEWDSGDRDNPTPFWDPEYEWWRSFEYLEVKSYGHCDDPDNKRGILTIKTAPSFSADCWKPTIIPWPGKLPLTRKGLEEAEKYGINLVHAEWYLVASFG